MQTPPYTTKKNLKLFSTPSAWLSTTSSLSLNLHPQHPKFFKLVLKSIHLHKTAWLLRRGVATFSRTIAQGQGSWILLEYFCIPHLYHLQRTKHCPDGLYVSHASLGFQSSKVQELKLLEVLKFKSLEVLNLQVQQSESYESSQVQRHESYKAQKSKVQEFKVSNSTVLKSRVPSKALEF